MPFAPSVGPLAPEVGGEWNTSTGKAPTSFWDAVREAFGLNGPPGSRAAPQALATPEGTRRAEHESYGAAGVLPSKGPAAGEVAGERDTAAAKRDLEQKVKAIDAWPMLSLPSAAPMIAELSDPASSLSIFSARALSSAAALSLIAASLYWVCCSSSARRLAISCCSVVWSAASCS